MTFLEVYSLRQDYFDELLEQIQDIRSSKDLITNLEGVYIFHRYIYRIRWECSCQVKL